MTDEVAAVVLAAGAGTRLRPLTNLRPKALCPVGNVPLVDLALERVRPLTTSVAVNVHHGRRLMVEHLSGRVHLSIEEPVALGTAGALGHLRDWIDGRPTLVVNADAWHHFDLSTILRDWDGERIRLLAVQDPARGDFGAWRHCGASLMPWSEVCAFAPVPSGLYEASWNRARTDGRLELVPVAGVFFDCGTPPDYLAANLASARGGSVVGEGARVDGELVRSVVWPGGIVHPGERLVECIRAGSDVTVRAGAASGQSTLGRGMAWSA